MDITFDPPLRETITVVSPVLLPQRQTTPVLFTARLSALDYEQLDAAGGCIEAWSNIPSNASNSSNRSWNGRKFVTSARPDEVHSGAYTLSLQFSSDVDHPQTRTLYLPIALPPLGSAETLRFAFTYRIVYPSGKIRWLGTTQTNGALILKASAERLLNDLTLSAEWQLDSSQQAYVQETNDVEDLEVATIKNPSQSFRTWALGKNGFISNLTNASALIFVPKEAEKTQALCPTYIFAASPNMTLSVSPNNLVTISGSGRLILRTKDELQDPAAFVEQIMSHCNLDGWNILASDIKEQAVVLAPRPLNLPIRCAFLSFWPSHHMTRLIELDRSLLDKALTKFEAEEFAIIPANRESIHVFAIQQTQPLRAAYPRIKISSRDFTITPVYRLTGQNARTSRQDWGAVITTDHKVLAPRPTWNASAPPTPPASPPPSQTEGISLQSDVWKSDILSQGFDASLPGETKSGEDIGDDIKEQDGLAEGPGQYRAGPSVELNLHNHPTPPLEAANKVPVYLDRDGRSFLSIYRHLFASLGSIVRLIVMCVFWVRQVSFGGNTLLTDADAQTAPTIDHARPVADEGPISFDREHDIDREQASPSRTPPGSLSTFEKGDSMESDNFQTSLGTIQSAARLDNPVPKSVHHLFYSELFPFEANGDNNLMPATTLVDIVLVPLPNLNEPPNDALSASSHESQSFPLAALETTVAFIDGLGPLSCAITQLQSFWFANGVHVEEDCSAPEAAEPIHFASYLLQYQLCTEDGNKGKVISIQMPSL
ncbi:hypothetical protein HYPSUDRAFT_199243 [Hypholoma sublateritium FD-334 SS-4]|uniref:Uncharacterized protein n=1 Tax=Hypholoma sublateritium (strain FD-334 SS-4) TaxID=945553 RepID=A0A0D2Q369_HYPSF|nr:hypothetical protein HYPSUDRAFT_199243 [Hypholoma sublateritium FD-334 SS-4]